MSGATAAVARYAHTGRVGKLLRPGNGNLPDDLPWAADNGAFAGFDASAFVAFVERIKGHSGCWWVACPDVVADHSATLARFSEWEPMIHDAGLPVAFVLQDGCAVAEVPWQSCEAVFIGGSTKFKLSDSARTLVREGAKRGKLTHMGRVNTARRIWTAREFGVDSIDGTSFSRWSDIYIPLGIGRIESAERQLTLF